MRLGVILDLDGTLARVGGSWPAWRARLAADLGVDASGVDRFGAAGFGAAGFGAAGFGAALERALGVNGPVTLAGACRAALAEIGAPAPPDLTEIAADAVRRYAREARLLPGAEALLATARAEGAGVAVVTNGPDDMQRAVLAACGIDERIDLAVVSGAADVGVRKPHPKVFWLASTGLGVRPADALVVGDSLEADVRGAHRFGCATCWIAGPGARPDLPAGGEPPPAGTVVVADTEAAVQVVREFVRG